MCLQELPISHCFTGAIRDPISLTPHRDLSLCVFRVPRPLPSLVHSLSIGNLLVPVPSSRSPTLACWHCLVALGSNIYKIGGPIEQKPSTSVSVLDCRSHTWREAPSLQVKRLCPSICVGGGCGDNGDFGSLKSVEVFDSNTQTWDQVPSPNPNRNVIWTCCTPRSVCIEGKFHLILGRGCMAYDPKEGRWDLVEPEIARNASFGLIAP